ncbi:hypothetical protein HNP98_003309 [Hymenobacter sp. 9A]|uniref:Uncharacterized protein n=1 Tax=Hymenobacter caeli TaxID=2735894 RepID=A0ABX2FVF4_9BACT|nr:hypothetical protein [Hymenobacter caeli]
MPPLAFRFLKQQVDALVAGPFGFAAAKVALLSG